MQYTAQKHYNECKNSKYAWVEAFDRVKLEVLVLSLTAQGFW